MEEVLAEELDEVVTEDGVDEVTEEPLVLAIDETGGGCLTTALVLDGGEFGGSTPAALFARSSCKNGFDRKVTAACSIAARSARIAGLSFASPVAIKDFTLLLD